MMTIDSKQAAEALGDIEAITRRVQQSQFYQLSSLMMIWWGALVLMGNVVSHFAPRYAGYAWIAVYVAGIAGSFAISALQYTRAGARTFDFRMLLAFVLFIGFGFLVTSGLGHYGPRELSAFWPIYFMLAYCLVGLWTGPAYIVIGLSVTVLTLVGYFWIGPWFMLWMALVNGGGLIVGGLWMRRG